MKPEEERKRFVRSAPSIIRWFREGGDELEIEYEVTLSERLNLIEAKLDQLIELMQKL